MAVVVLVLVVAVATVAVVGVAVVLVGVPGPVSGPTYRSRESQGKTGREPVLSNDFCYSGANTI